MPSLTDFQALSFDCYGTLVDWERGITEALGPITSRLPEDSPLKDRDTLLNTFDTEASALQASGPGTPYNQVLESAYRALATKNGVSATPEAEQAFSATIGSWPVFPDTLEALRRLKKHFKLIILSNVDNRSFRETLAGPLAGIDFDAVYVAEDIGSYKPDSRNFEYLARRCAEELHVPRERLLHTAYALNHDLAPASKLGLSTCYIERHPNALGGSIDQAAEGLKLDYSFATLQEFADAADAADAAFASNVAAETETEAAQGEATDAAAGPTPASAEVEIDGATAKGNAPASQQESLPETKPSATEDVKVNGAETAEEHEKKSAEQDVPTGENDKATAEAAAPVGQEKTAEALAPTDEDIVAAPAAAGPAEEKAPATEPEGAAKNDTLTAESDETAKTDDAPIAEKGEPANNADAASGALISTEDAAEKQTSVVTDPDAADKNATSEPAATVDKDTTAPEVIDGNKVASQDQAPVTDAASKDTEQAANTAAAEPSASN